MTSVVVHPGRERLLMLLVPASAKVVDTQLQSHVDHCALCQSEVRALTKDLDTLRRRSGVAVVGRVGTHPSDADLVAYVSDTLDTIHRRLMDAHLASCGACMKEILSMRAHRAAQRGDEKVTGTAPDVLPLRASKQHTRSSVLWQGLIAASVAVVTVSVWSLRGMPGVGPNGQTTVPPMAQVSPAATDPIALPALNPEPIVVAKAPTVAPPAPVEHSSSTTTTEPKVSPMMKVALGFEGVNWQAGVIETTAVGTVDMSRMKNAVHAEVTAENTARHLAYVQLAEMIDGVRVTSDVSYRDLALRVSDLKVRTDGFIRGAEVVKKSLEWVNGVPKATITLRVRLYGRDGVGGMTEKYVVPGDAKTKSPQPSGRSRSRVLVDARGTGFAPALHVALQAGSFNTTVPVTDAAESNAYTVRYVSTVEEALDQTRTDAAPRIIKAAASSAPGVLNFVDSDVSAALTEQAEYMVVF